ncbi:hypothetical protein M3Y97_00757100 [Aphelenchoides bicaudatus]|nr:hypothetical protein M3Y97_00757100 [Aphelenchoides bicaudatus]
MIPFSKWLWRHVLFATGILVCHILLIVYFTFRTNQFETNSRVYYALYLLLTSIFVLSTFSVVFKKAACSTFGYEQLDKLLLWFRVSAYLSGVFLGSILIAFIVGSGYQQIIFILTSAVNFLCCGLLARTFDEQIVEIRRYLHAVVMANSHKGLTISQQEAQICCKLDVERTKLQAAYAKEHRSVAFDALQNVQYFNMMRWLHKLRLLIGANERERQWRISELYHEIHQNAANMQIDEENANEWKKLAEQLAIVFPYSQETEFADYENKHFNENLETVD